MSSSHWNNHVPPIITGNRSGLTRRSVLQGAGLGASALLLSACSTRADGPPEAAVDISESQKSLRFDGRATYRNSVGEDFPLLGDFTDQTSIKVTFLNAVGDDNLYYQKVKDQLKLGRDIGADASVLSDWMAVRWNRLGYVQNFDHANVPNFDNVRQRFKEVDWDRGRRFSLPWRNGFTGIAYNKEAVPEGITSISQLWDASLHGKVGVLADMRDTLGLIMLDSGVDISTRDWGDAEFTAAVEVLREHINSGQIHSIKGDKYKEDLVSGATVASIARASDILQLNEEAGDKWGFALPDKGGVLWSDEVIIPIGSTHRSNAEKFINFYYDPQVAAQVSAATHFISPVDIRQDVIDDIDDAIASNVMVFPSTVTFQEVRKFRMLNQGEEQRYLAQYQTILLAAT